MSMGFGQQAGRNTEAKKNALAEELRKMSFAEVLAWSDAQLAVAPPDVMVRLARNAWKHQPHRPRRKAPP
jgi:hypothetical protein